MVITSGEIIIYVSRQNSNKVSDKLSIINIQFFKVNCQHSLSSVFTDKFKIINGRNKIQNQHYYEVLSME